MKPNLACRPSLEGQYETEYQKIQQIKRHLKAQRKSKEAVNHQSHKILFSKQKTKRKKGSPPERISEGINGGFKLVGKLQGFHSGSSKRLNTLNTERLEYHKNFKPEKTLSIKEYLVEHENKKLIEAIKSHELNKKQYKRKLATEVGEYVKLREHMQKYKKNFTVVLSRGPPKTERQNSCDFRKFLTEAIEETKRKMEPKQFYTRTTDHD